MYPDKDFDALPHERMQSQAHEIWLRSLEKGEDYIAANQAFCAIHAFTGQVHFIETEGDMGSTQHVVDISYRDAIPDPEQLYISEISSPTRELTRAERSAEYIQLVLNWAELL